MITPACAAPAGNTSAQDASRSRESSTRPRYAAAATDNTVPVRKAPAIFGFMPIWVRPFKGVGLLSLGKRLGTENLCTGVFILSDDQRLANDPPERFPVKLART